MTPASPRKIAAEAARIVDDVRRRGDVAVLEWTRRLDDARATGGFELPVRDIERGWDETPAGVRRAIRSALAGIKRVARRQRPRPFRIAVRPGVFISQRVEPLAQVGCYVPGGRYPLPSTLLMTVAPASIAGVADITVACPRPAPAVLCAALEAGATRVLRIGGAQAIAALAYGTTSIARVDKIVGPGNAWVAAAKSYVSRDCAIDFHAGPSEIVICSDRGEPAWIAADLLAQAEHDPAARAILVTTRTSLARAVARELRDRHSGNCTVVTAASAKHAASIVNDLAPEHLVCDRAEDVSRFRTAGTIFVGRWSAQACGDYATGSNHVLPTGGAARARGGLTAADFVRVFTVQTLTRRGLKGIAATAVTLARAEGLEAHARSIEVRL